ncbi:MAG: hypothetical protein AB7O49_10565 [Sphingomonadales bacterium]
MKEALLKALKTLQARFQMAPRYQPEKHYMRGPGPACAAKVSRAPENR